MMVNMTMRPCNLSRTVQLLDQRVKLMMKHVRGDDVDDCNVMRGMLGQGVGIRGSPLLSTRPQP